MHELAVTESILKVALRNAEAGQAKKILAVGLRIGDMTELQDEWIQRYFDYLSKGTLAEGAVLKIERSPIVFLCDDCKESFNVKLHEISELLCPACRGSNIHFVSGREFFIKDIEVL